MRSRYKFLIFFIGYMRLFFPAHTQILISGEVTDAVSFKPIAFVHVFNALSPNQGTYTDIDGRFALNIDTLPTVLNFSIIGYEKYSQSIQYGIGNLLQIRLQPSVVELPLYIFTLGQNQAELILKKLLQRRDILNPNKLQSYSYTAYHKFLFTGLGADDKSQDSIQITTNKEKDTLLQQLNQILHQQHLFINETVSEKRFMKPDKHYEKITASRTSGMDLPVFSTLMLQMQSISFY
ncbi:MAG: carboxypeptidase-like regulatory domain-containing protein, partial [Flavobacteriales bacterium]|nr:carboxypeptidase-like regulatory domain-containing protein [Flavobacteriales bacterium]